MPALSPRIPRASAALATLRPYFAQSATARSTSAAFDGASTPLSSLRLSSSPVRVCPPAAIDHSLSTIWLAPIPAPHHCASGAIRFTVSM